MKKTRYSHIVILSTHFNQHFVTGRTVRVDKLMLHANRSHRNANGRRMTYEFEEFEPTRVSCSSRGGNPPPQLRIYLGDKDVTSEFQEFVEDVPHGPKGLEMVTHDVTLVNDEFMVRAEDSGKHLSCTAVMRGHEELNKNVSGTVDVKCKDAWWINQSFETHLFPF